MYRIVKLLFLAAGLALLALIVAGMDLTEVVGLVRQVGWGIAVLLGLYFLAFMLDTVSWQITLLKLNGSACTISRTAARRTGSVGATIHASRGSITRRADMIAV